MLFTDVDFGRPLPIRDSVATAESGNGYALRMVVENHLKFCDLTRALASIGHRYLPHSAAQRLAFWFGADPLTVSRAIPASYKLNGQTVSLFLDQQFKRPYHIRLSRPQLCPQCLDELGYACAVWDISLMVCCPKHEVLLIDHCPKCNRRVSWRRPSLWTCRCGANFRSAKPAKADASLIWLSSQIDSLLMGSPKPAAREKLEYEVLSMLGVDALLRVIRALGVSEGEVASDIVPGRLTRVLSSAEAQQ